MIFASKKILDLYMLEIGTIGTIGIDVSTMRVSCPSFCPDYQNRGKKSGQETGQAKIDAGYPSQVYSDFPSPERMGNEAQVSRFLSRFLRGKRKIGTKKRLETCINAGPAPIVPFAPIINTYY
jgi:hypothetical protein